MSPPAQNGRPRASPGDPATPEWASGRSLTESQRLRKREVDRIRSRKHRQSTLTRITELEAKLQCVLAGESDSRLKQRKPLGEWNEDSNSADNQISEDTLLQRDCSRFLFPPRIYRRLLTLTWYVQTLSLHSQVMVIPTIRHMMA